jgi:hypothetical protein|tara:strand:+ start:647 stop:1060 length:414 start_codon:yes stop_codon:yes gene_type:complete
MTEEVNNGNKPLTPEESIQAIQSSIANAFNLGLQSKPKEGADTIADVVKEIQNTIYGQLKESYGDVPEDFIKANAEFFVQVAAMGYIIPRVCAFDQDFQVKLFKLIETRVLETQKAAQEQAGEEKGNIITEDKKIII